MQNELVWLVSKASVKYGQYGTLDNCSVELNSIVENLILSCTFGNLHELDEAIFHINVECTNTQLLNIMLSVLWRYEELQNFEMFRNKVVAKYANVDVSKFLTINRFKSQ